MGEILSRNLCLPHGGQRCLGPMYRLKDLLHVSLQLPDNSSVWTPVSPSHSVGLGCKVWRTVNSCIELSVYSLSLEELIH